MPSYPENGRRRQAEEDGGAQAEINGGEESQNPLAICHYGTPRITPGEPDSLMTCRRAEVPLMAMHWRSRNRCRLRGFAFLPRINAGVQ